MNKKFLHLGIALLVAINCANAIVWIGVWMSSPVSAQLPTVTSSDYVSAARQLIVGGGYGDTGTNIEANGNINTNGNLTVDGTATLTGAISSGGAITSDGLITGNTAAIATSATFSGGYGSTGATISDGGDIYTDGALGIAGTEVYMTALPTADPGVAGQLWDNSGALNVSAGP